MYLAPKTKTITAKNPEVVTVCELSHPPGWSEECLAGEKSKEELSIEGILS